MNSYLHTFTLIIAAVALSVTPLSANEKVDRIVWPSAPDPARIQYEGSFTKAADLKIEKGFWAKAWSFIVGDEDPVINKPFGLHTDDKRIYVTDKEAGTLFIFGTKENEFKAVRGGDDDPFRSLIDVTTDEKGTIYLSDSVSGVIHVLSKNGKHQRTIGKGKLHRPTGIAYSTSKKLLYVCDTVENTIKLFDTKGKVVNTIGKGGSHVGQFNKPTFIALDKDDTLYVSDSMNQRIQIFDAKGKFLRTFGEIGNQIGEFANPRGIAVDNSGNIYVTDTIFNAIQIFSNNGELLMLLGNYGNAPGQFSLPEDIEITKDGKIYVSDLLNGRIQTFQLLPEQKK